jgi:hypothetical protein
MTRIPLDSIIATVAASEGQVHADPGNDETPNCDHIM